MIAGLKSEETSQMQLVERDEMDEDDDLFEAIDKLIAQGINAGDVKKLQDACIHTCNGLMMHTKKNLTGIKGLSEAKVDKICEAAEKILLMISWYTNFFSYCLPIFFTLLESSAFISPQCLVGGIETAAITETFGEFSSVVMQLPTSMKGGNGKLAYIDTEGTLSALIGLSKLLKDLECIQELCLTISFMLVLTPMSISTTCFLA
ncbi:hypothetical protein Bca52824_026402 [Brassica carinata]|uniref:Rad51-like C-terminal domain-containing protein n=1 Tax=Brassica carinata TaxID=52824 RepID=A0A8X7SL19_BRACI|nr:hypothetical protein Bca52824_026402 [Brassica carinata]